MSKLHPPLPDFHGRLLSRNEHNLPEISQPRFESRATSLILRVHASVLWFLQTRLGTGSNYFPMEDGLAAELLGSPNLNDSSIQSFKFDAIHA